MTPLSLAHRPGRPWFAARRALLLVLLVLLGMALPAGQALAQPAAVEDLIREGVELRKQGKDHLALPKFQKAYDLTPSGRTAGQLGLAEASLGYWMSAERHLNESLSDARNPWVARNEDQLRKTLQGVRASIGEIEVTGTPSGAEVTVNGQVAGRLPLGRPVRVAEGSVVVSLSAPGYGNASTNILVEGGRRARVNLALERTPAASAAPPVVGGPAPSVEPPEEEEETPVRRSRRGGGPASWVRPASWFATAGALGALAVGAYGLNAQHGRVDEFDRYMPPGSTNTPCNQQAGDKGGPECKRLFTRIQSAERLALGGFVTGGVLAAAALAGFIYSSSDGGGTEESDVAFSLELGNPSTGAPFRLGLALTF